jgi:muramoyltetrapeptide carboxypeptidase LdcA involved in peptidoglycan recycling
MMQLKTGDTIALVGNSNPQTNPQEIEQLCRLLQNMGVIIVKSPLLFDEATTNASKKATVLQSYLKIRPSKLFLIFPVAIVPIACCLI